MLNKGHTQKQALDQKSQNERKQQRHTQANNPNSNKIVNVEPPKALIFAYTTFF